MTGLILQDKLSANTPNNERPNLGVTLLDLSSLLMTQLYSRLLSDQSR
jgi:hypothetical protein